MQIRSELNALAEDIRAAQISCGDEKIKIGQVEMTVAKVAKNILDKLNTYQTEEKSLKGCIETSQNLLTALNDLRERSPNPDKEKDLISIIRKVKSVIASAFQTQKDLQGKVSSDVEKITQELIKNEYTSFSTRQKITNSAAIPAGGFFRVSKIFLS